MLEKPDIADALIISRLQEEYDLRVATLTFLPLGADMSTIVYRVGADDGCAYFLKLRKGFSPLMVSVPLLLASDNIREIIAPLATKSKSHWVNCGDYTIVLYPFVDANNGFELALSQQHKRRFGTALKAVHSTKIPPQLQKLIPRETYSAFFRERMKTFQMQAAHQTFHDATATKLVAFMKEKRDAIDHLIERAQTLACHLQTGPADFVLCHSDLHGGNVMISTTNELYIVDWDAPVLALKERDLMFIGSGIDEIWTTKDDEAMFYDGYGETDINLEALAYYRYERIIVDLVEFCDQLLLTDKGGADREEAYRWFTFNFERGRTIDRAEKAMFERDRTQRSSSIM